MCSDRATGAGLVRDLDQGASLYAPETQILKLLPIRVAALTNCTLRELLVLNCLSGTKPRIAK
jgi:hypothetical protein